jgi:hypothetical protein
LFEDNRVSLRCFFDGHKLLSSVRLPIKFKIINNNVPISYWNRNILWFDCSDVQDQCLNNVYIDNETIKTRFKYNIQEYEIIYKENYENTKEDSIRNFANIIGSYKLLLIKYLRDNIILIAGPKYEKDNHSGLSQYDRWFRLGSSNY